MLVLPGSNSYAFSNMTVQITDNTVIVDDTISPEQEIPEFTFLIPTVQEVGITNQMTMFRCGEPNRYLLSYGNPNAAKYGFGPDFIHGILSKNADNVGVWVVNLRGATATAANVICKMMYRIVEAVPYTDTDGNPYYKTPEGELTTEPSDENEPVVRDVLYVKFVTESAPDIHNWIELNNYMESLYSETPDDDGYKTIPWFAAMYRGNTAFGNNCYFSMSPKAAEYDGNMYYAVTLFDGMKSSSTDYICSMEPSSGEKYDTSYYMENQFNNNFANFRYITAGASNDLMDLVSKYLYTVEDYLAGKTDTPSVEFAEVDMFNVNSFAIQVEMDSLNIQLTNAFALASGDNGTETADELFESFFKGEIITDIADVVRYRINYIPDIGYNDATKQAIISLIDNRVRMTTATLMVGGNDTFNSALIDHQANYFETKPCIRQLAKIQSPMRYNSFTKRTMTYPATYFDVMALVDHFIKWTNFYQPFAGAEARWTDFIEDTMQYPPKTTDFVNALYKNRVNVVMKDAKAGAYLSEQLMNTQFESDQTELNNAFLISNMLYDLVNLVHYNHYKFNEAEEVRDFNDAVNTQINKKYSPFSASLSCEVYRVGTVGRAKSRNKIKVTIDMKDISKYTDVELVLVDA